MDGITSGGGVDRSWIRVGLAALGAVLLIFGFTSGWSQWTVDAGDSGPGSGDIELTWKLNEVVTSGQGFSATESYDNDPDFEPVASLFDVTMLLLIGALIIGLAGLGLLLARTLGTELEWSTRGLRVGVLALAAVLALGACVQVMVGYPGAIEESQGEEGNDDPSDSFWGSNQAMSWGASLAWYMTLVSGLSLAAAAALPATPAGAEAERAPEIRLEEIPAAESE